MESATSSQEKVYRSNSCVNCGATLEYDSVKKIKKCHYCGGEFEANGDPVARPEKENVSDNINLQKEPDTQSSINKGTVSPGMVLFWIIVVAVMTIVIVKTQYAAVTNIDAVVDSIKVDTTTHNDIPETKTESTENPELKELASIQIDPKTFKKFYAGARKKVDPVSNTITVYDRTSPQYVNRNGTFAYITRDGGFNQLRFSIQYYADDWLFIQEVKYNIDGDIGTYSFKFDRDNGDGKIWEWYDTDVDGSIWDTLVRLANAKKAQVKYSGDKYYKIVTITHAQQLAIKHILQLYKGLLLGYH